MARNGRSDRVEHCGRVVGVMSALLDCSDHRASYYRKMFSFMRTTSVLAFSAVLTVALTASAWPQTAPMPTPFVHGDLTCTWQFAGTAGPTCYLIQAHRDFIEGGCKGPEATGRIFGIWEGATVRLSYQWSLKADSSSIGAFEFVGRLERPGHLACTMMSTTNVTGPFTADRVQSP